MPLQVTLITQCLDDLVHDRAGDFAAAAGIFHDDADDVLRSLVGFADEDDEPRVIAGADDVVWAGADAIQRSSLWATR